MKNLPLIIAGASILCTSAHAVVAPAGGGVSPAGPKAIALQWTDASLDETAFKIERHNGDNNWAALATVEANTTYYYDRSGLTEQTTWHYRVRSIENTNNSSWLDLGSATTTITMNILFFFSDDMGYKDIVAHRNEAIDGPTLYETPAVDTLVSQGLTINNAYCSGPKCVVARRSVQVGKYDWRPEAVPSNKFYIDHDGVKIGGGIYAGGTTVTGSESGAGVTIPDNVTYGEAVKTAGYRTCFIGKYHLGESAGSLNTPVGYSFGDQPGRGPIDQGYDVSIASGHAGAPPGSYFSVENQHDLGIYTFELPDLDDSSYMLTPAVTAAGDYLNDRLTDKAIGFMDDVVNNHSTQPFHLSLAHYAVHTPMEAKTNANSIDGKGYEYFQAKKDTMYANGDFGASHPAGASSLVTDGPSDVRMWQDNPVYAAMMKNYDDSLAKIRAYLAATTDPRYPSKKLSETTIIVLTSDHGGKSTTASHKGDVVEAVDGTDTVNPPPVYVPADGAYRSAFGNAYTKYPTANYPYRMGKTWVYEGGLKVPMVIYFPGVTTAGSTSDAFVHHADLFATFCDMAGAAQQPTEATDSKSFLLTCGQPEATARNEMHHFFTNADDGTGNFALGAYRRGDYKLVYYMIQRKVELYNIVADPYEANDLATSRPELAEEMLHELYQQVLSTGKKMPKPGSNSWRQEQTILVGDLGATLPTPPTAAPSWDSLPSQNAQGHVEFSWTAGAGSTYTVIERSGPVERANNGGSDSYREVDYLPAGTLSWVDQSAVFNSGGDNLYKYRLQSENIGGFAGMTIHSSGEYSEGSSTTSGNRTITITAPVSSSCDAVDDTITTIPGELREFNPLINDVGVGDVAVTAITQPTEGSATFDGKYIYFSSPQDFSGNATMTYTITDADSNMDTATITIGFPVEPASINTLEIWNFSETAGTQLEATNSDQSHSFTGTTSASVATDGAGSLVLKSDSTNHNRESDPLVIGAQTTGRHSMEWKITSADMSNSTGGTSSFGFGFRDTNTNTDFGIIRVIMSGGKLILQATAVPTTTTLYDFNVATLSNVVIKSTLDLDTLKIETRLTIGGGGEIICPTVNATSAGNFDIFKFQGRQNATDGWNALDEVKIDYLSLSEEVATVSLYDHWATAYPWLGVKETSATDDPDADGIDNLMEFAFGLDPLVNNPKPSPSITVGSPSSVSFTPYRDTSLLTYTVEFSDDLSVWDSYTAFSIATPAGQEVNVNLPTGDRVFSRVHLSTP